LRAKACKPIDVSREALLAIVDNPSPSDDDRQRLRDVIETLALLMHEIEAKSTTIARLRKMLFGASTEKTSSLFGEGTDDGSGSEQPSARSGDEERRRDKPKAKGHGRHHADAYRGAERRCVKHESLAPGECCPDCGKGKLYELREPTRLVRIRGQAPIAAIVAELQRLRCSLCGKVFPAQTPPDFAGPKYDETASAMICVHKYGNGFPFTRLERMQKGFRIPLPATTQWDLVKAHGCDAAPAYEELIWQGAQSDVVHNDDTPMTILALRSTKGFDEDEDVVDLADGADRTATQTTAVVCTSEGRHIALFFTGRRNAGENLTSVLRR